MSWPFLTCKKHRLVLLRVVKMTVKNQSKNAPVWTFGSAVKNRQLIDFDLYSYLPLKFSYSRRVNRSQLPGEYTAHYVQPLLVLQGLSNILISHSWVERPNFGKMSCSRSMVASNIWNHILRSVVAERSSALDSSSGVARMWVWIPAWPVAALVFLSKTLNHNCFVLRMGRKAVGPVCCVMHVKEPRTLIVKEKGLAPVFLDSRLEHPAGWICARYKSYHYYYYYY